VCLSDVCWKFARAHVSDARLRRIRDSDDYRHDDIWSLYAPISEARLLQVPKMRMHAWRAATTRAKSGRSFSRAKFFALTMEREAAIRLLRALVAVGLRQRESMANATIRSVAFQAGLEEFNEAQRYARQQGWLVPAGKSFSTTLTPAGWRAARGE
jgi:hypothetical protein